MIDDTTKPDAQLLDEEAERLAEILLGSPVVPKTDDADLLKTPSTDSLFPVSSVIDDDAAIIMGDLWEPVTDEVPVVELGLDLEDDAANESELESSDTSSVLIPEAKEPKGPKFENSGLFGTRIPESTKKISVEELFAEEPPESEEPKISVGKLFGDKVDDATAGPSLTAPIFGAKVAPSQVEFVPVEEVSDRRRPAAVVAGSIFALLLLVALIAFFTGDDANDGPTEISAVPATTIELTTTTAETTTSLEQATTTLQTTTVAPSTSRASTTLASTTEAPTTTVAPATAAPTTRRVVTTRRPATTRRVTTTAAPATTAPAPTAAPTTPAPTTAPPTTQAATTVVPTFSIDAGE